LILIGFMTRKSAVFFDPQSRSEFMMHYALTNRFVLLAFGRLRPGYMAPKPRGEGGND
jgi:hypothetical protein